MAQVPRGSDVLVCPLHRRTMSKVCHTCPWWTHVRGTNPNTGSEVDEWKCAIAWLPMLTIEVAQKSNQTGAAVESFRNEVVKSARQQVAAAATIHRITHARHDRS